MRLFYRNEWIVAALCAAVVVIGAHFGLSAKYGADPNWALQIAYLGAIAGILLEFFMVQEKGWILAKSVVILAFFSVALMVATIARAQYDLTDGSDDLAGWMWYLGAVGVAAGVFMALFLVFATLLCKRGR